MLKNDIQFPYGAVYFRKSNPPREDWERDYTTAGEDGLNIFRHWFMWSAIETSPGVYDWEEYDRQLDLAAKNGIKTVIAGSSMPCPTGRCANMPMRCRSMPTARNSVPIWASRPPPAAFPTMVAAPAR